MLHGKDQPIMLKILPIMLCCIDQNFAYYAQYFVPQFPRFAIKFAIHE